VEKNAEILMARPWAAHRFRSCRARFPAAGLSRRVPLLGAGLLETGRATVLTFFDGFSRVWPSAMGLTAAVASFIGLKLVESR
jgi:hypothetical protein